MLTKRVEQKTEYFNQKWYQFIWCQLLLTLKKAKSSVWQAMEMKCLKSCCDYFWIRQLEFLISSITKRKFIYILFFCFVFAKTCLENAKVNPDIDDKMKLIKFQPSNCDLTCGASKLMCINLMAFKAVVLSKLSIFAFEPKVFSFKKRQ